MATYEAAVSAFRSGATASAEALALELLAQAREEGDLAGHVDALCMLARVALRRADFLHAGELAAEARALARRTGRPSLERMPIHLRAAATRMRGAYSEARFLYEESIELNIQLGEARMVASEHRNLAYVELHDGHADRARELFRSAAAEARALADDALEPYLLLDAAVIAFESGDSEQAARLAGAMRVALAAIGQIPDPDDAAEEELLQARLLGKKA